MVGPLKRVTDISSKPPLFQWSAALTATLTAKLDEPTIRFRSDLYVTLGVLIVYFSAKTIALHMTKPGRTKDSQSLSSGRKQTPRSTENSAELASENLVSRDDHNIFHKFCR
jgi:hypothetical protein